MIDLGPKNGAQEEELIKLIASTFSDVFSNIMEVTLNSPLGATIYEEKVGFNGEYEVGDNKMKVKIKKIGRTLEEIYADNTKK